MRAVLQEERQPHAEKAALAFQQLKAHLPDLFLQCSHLSAGLHELTQLTRFSTGPDQAHLCAPDTYDTVNSLDSKDVALAIAQAAFSASHTSELTNFENGKSARAMHSGPTEYAQWAQTSIGHKAEFKVACQVIPRLDEPPL